MEKRIKRFPPEEYRVSSFWEEGDGHEICVNHTMNEGIQESKKCRVTYKKVNQFKSQIRTEQILMTFL